MPDEPAELLVDPAVSRAKFQRELDRYREIADDRRRLGWWILSAEFPDVLVAFTTPQIRPAPVIFGALINFDNYDLWAPSVRIVDPFSKEPLRLNQIPQPMRMLRRVPVQEVAGVGTMMEDRPMLLAHSEGDIPFLCLPGVREYHDHPHHSGDPWLLHRDRGEGALYFILEKLYTYGAQPIRGYQFGLQVVGFLRAEPPQ